MRLVRAPVDPILSIRYWVQCLLFPKIPALFNQDKSNVYAPELCNYSPLCYWNLAAVQSAPAPSPIDTGSQQQSCQVTYPKARGAFLNLCAGLRYWKEAQNCRNDASYNDAYGRMVDMWWADGGWYSEFWNLRDQLQNSVYCPNRNSADQNARVSDALGSLYRAYYR